MQQADAETYLYRGLSPWSSLASSTTTRQPKLLQVILSRRDGPDIDISESRQTHTVFLQSPLDIP